MQLPPVLCSLSCYWCHPLIIFHSCFQYPALYESWFSSFMYQHSCALCMCKYKQCKYIWWLWQCLCVCPLYKYTHKFECIWAPGFLCGCLKKKTFLLFFTTTCVLVCIIHSDYLSSAVCLTTGVVSFDCIDLVLPHAVMKDEKWTAWSECEVIGLHPVSHDYRKPRGEEDGRNIGSVRQNSLLLFVKNWNCLWFSLAII